MKKSTKSAKPAAPQVKSVVPKPVEPKPVKKTAAPRKKAAPKAAPVPEPAASPLPSTKIAARIDIGFGNALFIRGEGPGLSWDRGVALDCAADDLWIITLPASDSEVVFKFLVNDLSWSSGEDYIAASGASVELVPTF